MKRKLIIIGAGGHAVSVANIAISVGYEIAAFVDVNKAGSKLLNYEVLRSIESIGDHADYFFAIAIGDNFVRNKVFKDLSQSYPEMIFPALIHPSAVISHFSTIEIGSVVMPLSLVGPNTVIGKFCLLNSKSSIDHDGLMEDFSSLAPGAILGGSVIVGHRSVVSIGAVVKHGIKIGCDSVLGANSYLNTELADGCLAYGTPAAIVRARSPGDSYL